MSDFFDKLANKGKELLSTAKETANDLIEKGKDKAEELKLEHDLTETFAALGIDQSEIVAFGDAQNDRTMLEWAGIGVAMGNAVDEVKVVADKVTLSNNEDGIAVALEELLPELYA